MLAKGTKWFCMVVVITVIGISMLSLPAFAEGKGSGTKEGIKVHGHWKIEIFNPDGKRVSVTEFDNAYIGQAHNTIPDFLTGTRVPGGWLIRLDAATGERPCDNAGTSTWCVIGESGPDYAPLYTLHNSNLTVTSNSNSISLVGSVTAAYASTIDKVSSQIMNCDPVNTPSVCKTNLRTGGAWGFSNFTDATLAAPPSIVPGQLIQVTVTVSFS